MVLMAETMDDFTFVHIFHGQFMTSMVYHSLGVDSVDK